MGSPAVALIPTSLPVQASVLVLEDDLTTRLMLCAALARTGVRVLEAGRISEAEKVIAQNRVDLVVVDGLLPDGRGIDFIEKLRGEGRDVRVVFLSSFFQDLRSHRALRNVLHVSTILKKPVAPNELAAEVDATLAHLEKVRSGV